MPDRTPLQAGLGALFAPRAIAVVGASPDVTRLPGRPLGYLARYGFEGDVHPVNPRHTGIGGRRCVPRIDDLPDGVDLALLLVPSAQVVDAVRDCARRGIGFAISIAGGFAEAGNAALQQRLAEVAREGGVRLVGPNCVGILDPRSGLTATFSTVLRTRMPRPGRIALVTQSGALGNSLLQSFNELDLGLAAWVSTGNEADLGILDFVAHFLDDPTVDTIGCFVEGLNDGARLAPLGRLARERGKAIVVLRAGRSEAGRAASVSHTGKLAGAARVWEGIVRQAGLIEVDSVDALVDVLAAADVLGRVPAGAASGLGILTISGGLGVLLADAAAAHGLRVPAFSEATRAALRELLPAQMSVANPVDTALFTDETGYGRCAEHVLADPGVGTLVLVLTSLAHDYQGLLPWLEQLGSRAKATGKSVVITFLSSADVLPREARVRLHGAGVLVLTSGERTVAALARRSRMPSEPGPVTILPKAGPPSEGWLAVIPRIEERVCQDVGEAIAFADRHGWPVALKVASPDLPHKTDVGAVAIGLADAGALRSAWTAMQARVAALAPQARIDGWAVQPMAPAGVELIAGYLRDPEFGPVALVGAGGIWTEITADGEFLALPATDEEIGSALRRLRLAPRFDGLRGAPRVDLASAVKVIRETGLAFVADPGLAALDINPLIVSERGAVAVDWLAERAGDPRPARQE